MASDLPPDRFNSQWRAVATVARCGISDVDSFIASHYLHLRPAIVLLCLSFSVLENPFGCIVFSAPPRETSVRYKAETWELARLYATDEMPRNTESWMIGQAVNYIRRNHKAVRVLVSYADPSAGHAGTIYRASNWQADGMTDAGRKTPRCDYVDTRTGKKYGRRGNVPIDAVLSRVPRVSKHRFVLRLYG